VSYDPRSSVTSRLVDKYANKHNTRQFVLRTMVMVKEKLTIDLDNTLTIGKSKKASWKNST
jgi:hypothetical protein